MKLLKVKLTPNAKQNAIMGWETDEHRDAILKVSVTAIPEKGKANAALIKLLSKTYKIPKSSIKITKGDTNRLKTLEIDGPRSINELIKIK